MKDSKSHDFIATSTYPIDWNAVYFGKVPRMEAVPDLAAASNAIINGVEIILLLSSLLVRNICQVRKGSHKIDLCI